MNAQTEMTIAQLLKLDSHTGYTDCPVCGGAKKLKYSAYHAKCFRTSCAVNKGVDKNTLASLLDIELPTYKHFRKPIRHLVFEAYENYLKTHPELYEYLVKRGYEYAIETTRIGFAPADTKWLTDAFNQKDLQEAHLLGTQPFFRDRFIFPIYNEHGCVVHMQGRSIDPNEDIRWLSTKTPNNGYPINDYLFNGTQKTFDQINKGQALFICEGISDCMSLVDLGLNAVATLGLEPKLIKYYNQIKNSNADYIVAIYDNDLQNIESSGAFKSWDVITKHLIELMYHTKKPVYVFTPPYKDGKDMNDWCRSGVSRSKIICTLHNDGEPLLDFVKDRINTLKIDPVDLLKFYGESFLMDLVSKL